MGVVDEHWAENSRGVDWVARSAVEDGDEGPREPESFLRMLAGPE